MAGKLGKVFQLADNQQQAFSGRHILEPQSYQGTYDAVCIHASGQTARKHTAAMKAMLMVTAFACFFLYYFIFAILI